MSKKILKHIEKDEIVRRLTEGESIRNIYKWLKDKYPNNKKLWISTVSLQKFRKDNLQLDGKVLKDIQEASQIQQRELEEQQRIAQLKSSNAYQDKINEIADTHLDVARKILQLDKIIDHRMEYWFNAIKSGEANPSQADKEMRSYMDRQMALMQQYKKFVEGIADQTIEHNVNITVMNEQISVIRDVIRDVMTEFDPDTAMRFMDKLNKRLESLSYSPPEQKVVEGRVLDAIEANVTSGDF